MSRTILLPFAAAVLFSLLGAALTHDGVARLKRREAPPFNTGLYTATWEIPPPPEKLVLFIDAPIGRAGLWMSLFAVPWCAWTAFLRRDRPIAGLTIAGLWSALVGLAGIWTWAFSLFAPKL